MSLSPFVPQFHVDGSGFATQPLLFYFNISSLFPSYDSYSRTTSCYLCQLEAQMSSFPLISLDIASEVFGFVAFGTFGPQHILQLYLDSSCLHIPTIAPELLFIFYPYIHLLYVFSFSLLSMSSFPIFFSAAHILTHTSHKICSLHITSRFRLSSLSNMVEGFAQFYRISRHRTTLYSYSRSEPNTVMSYGSLLSIYFQI